MGNWNSGRRPQPNQLKVLRGNPNGHRLNDREPVGEPVTDAFDIPPAQLGDDAIAKEEWTRLAPLMRKAGMVSQGEVNALVALCQQWSRYLTAHQKVRELGMLVKGQAGEPCCNPFLAMSDKALTQCQVLWRELGLTPSSRSRLIALQTAEPVKDLNKWAGLI
jgi:P27 family predicted phage terminase small subunit